MPYNAEVNVDGLVPKSGGAGRDFNNHKLSDGDNIYRILPPFGTNHGGLPFAEVSLHWFVDNDGNSRPLRCSKATERFCPVCSDANELYNEKQSLVEEFTDKATNRTNWKLIPADVKAKYDEVNEKFNALKGQRGFYYNALNTSGVVGVLKLPKTAAAELGEKIKEAITTHGFNPLSLEKGTFFNIHRKRTGKMAFNVEYSVDFVKKSVTTESGVSLQIELSPTPKNVLDNFEKLAYDVHVSYPVRTAQQLKRAMMGDAELWEEINEQKEKAKEAALPKVAEEQTTVTVAAETPAAAPSNGTAEAELTSAPETVTVAALEAPASVVPDTAINDAELDALRKELGV